MTSAAEQSPPTPPFRLPRRIGTAMLIPLAIVLAMVVSRIRPIIDDDPSIRSSHGQASTVGTEFRYQLWKRNFVPADSILQEIDFRIRRDFTESSSPIVGPTSQPRVVPPLFEVPEAAVVERDLSGGAKSGTAPAFP